MRIQAELLRIATLTPVKGKSACISRVPTHANFAARVSTHREAVTREFNRLAKIGIIEQQKQGLVVKDLIAWQPSSTMQWENHSTKTA